MKVFFSVMCGILAAVGGFVVLSLWAAVIINCKTKGGGLTFSGWAMLVLPFLLAAAWGIFQLVCMVRNRRSGKKAQPVPKYRCLWWWLFVILQLIGGVTMASLAIAIGIGIYSWWNNPGRGGSQIMSRSDLVIICGSLVLIVLLVVAVIRQMNEEFRRCYLECPCGFKGKGKLCNNYNPLISLLLLGFDRLFTAMWYKAHTDREYVKCPRCGRTYWPRY